MNARMAIFNSSYLGSELRNKRPLVMSNPDTGIFGYKPGDWTKSGGNCGTVLYMFREVTSG